MIYRIVPLLSILLVLLVACGSDRPPAYGPNLNVARPGRQIETGETDITIAVDDNELMQSPEAQPTRKPGAVLLTLSEEEEIEAARQYGRKNFDNFVVFINGFNCKLPDNAFPVIKATHALVQDDWQVIEYNQLPECNSDQTCFQIWPYANNFIFDFLADWQSILDANNCGTYEAESVP